MVTAQIITIQIAYPSVQVEVAFTDDEGVLQAPTHLTYNIPVEEAKDMTPDTLNAKIQEDVTNFETIITKIGELQPTINTKMTATGVVTEGVVAK